MGWLIFEEKKFLRHVIKTSMGLLGFFLLVGGFLWIQPLPQSVRCVSYMNCKPNLADGFNDHFFIVSIVIFVIYVCGSFIRRIYPNPAAEVLGGSFKELLKERFSDSDLEQLAIERHGERNQ